MPYIFKHPRAQDIPKNFHHKDFLIKRTPKPTEPVSKYEKLDGESYDISYQGKEYQGVVKEDLPDKYLIFFKEPS